MDDIYPQILSYLQTNNVLLEIFRLTRNHHMQSRIKQVQLLDQIHELAGDQLTLNEKLKCYTQREIEYALEKKEFYTDEASLKFDALRGTYDLIKLLDQAGSNRTCNA